MNSPLSFAGQEAFHPVSPDHKGALETGCISSAEVLFKRQGGKKSMENNLRSEHAIPVVMAMPESLDKIIEQRVNLLTAYQNTRYAKQYLALVDRIQQKERFINGGSKRLPLATAVACNLAKLMSYKDEYEVARRYADPAFLQKMRSGPWVMHAFRTLAKLKILRGTALDIFGYTEERKMERRLISEYMEMLNEFCETLTETTLGLATELASLPDDIRGFGHVKERNVDSMIKRRAVLMLEYRSAKASRTIEKFRLDGSAAY